MCEDMIRDVVVKLVSFYGSVGVWECIIQGGRGFCMLGVVKCSDIAYQYD